MGINLGNAKPSCILGVDDRGDFEKCSFVQIVWNYCPEFGEEMIFNRNAFSNLTLYLDGILRRPEIEKGICPSVLFPRQYPYEVVDQILWKSGQLVVIANVFCPKFAYFCIHSRGFSLVSPQCLSVLRPYQLRNIKNSFICTYFGPRTLVGMGPTRLSSLVNS